MDIFEKVSKDIIAAMKAKDKMRLEALRNVKKFFIEAKTAREPTIRLMTPPRSKFCRNWLSRAATRLRSTANRAVRTWPRRRKLRLR